MRQCHTSLTKLKIAVPERGLLVTHGGVFQSWGYWWLFLSTSFPTPQSLIFPTFPQISFVTSRFSLGQLHSDLVFFCPQPSSRFSIFSLSIAGQACGPQVLAPNLEVPTSSVGKEKKSFTSTHPQNSPSCSPLKGNWQNRKTAKFISTCSHTHIPGSTQWWVAHQGG